MAHWNPRNEDERKYQEMSDTNPWPIIHSTAQSKKLTICMAFDYKQDLQRSRNERSCACVCVCVCVCARARARVCVCKLTLISLRLAITYERGVSSPELVAFTSRSLSWQTLCAVTLAVSFGSGGRNTPVDGYRTAITESEATLAAVLCQGINESLARAETEEKRKPLKAFVLSNGQNVSTLWTANTVKSRQSSSGQALGATSCRRHLCNTQPAKD